MAAVIPGTYAEQADGAQMTKEVSDAFSAPFRCIVLILGNTG